MPSQSEALPPPEETTPVEPSEPTSPPSAPPSAPASAVEIFIVRHGERADETASQSSYSSYSSYSDASSAAAARAKALASGPRTVAQSIALLNFLKDRAQDVSNWLVDLADVSEDVKDEALGSPRGVLFTPRDEEQTPRPGRGALAVRTPI